MCNLAKYYMDKMELRLGLIDDEGWENQVVRVDEDVCWAGERQ